MGEIDRPRKEVKRVWVGSSDMRTTVDEEQEQRPCRDEVQKARRIYPEKKLQSAFSHPGAAAWNQHPTHSFTPPPTARPAATA